MNEPRTYTATDIERYHRGQLSAADRHALEKAALDDPFLSDALEGYTFTQTPSAALTALQQRLQLRVEKKKKRRGTVYLNNCMKVAAMLLLFAGAGWMVFQLFNPKEKTLATKQTPIRPSSTMNKIEADSTSTVSDAPLTTQIPGIEVDKQSEQERSKQEPLARNAPNKPMPSLMAAPPTADSIASQANAFGRTQPSPELNEVAVVATKPAAPAIEKKEGYLSKQMDTITNFNVTLKHTDLPASETIVLNKKNKERSAARQMVVNIDSTEPLNGWTNFDDYIASNLKDPEESKTKRANGEVELSFDVNKEGEAVNIAVTKSLCDKCDEEAIRLLKDGPKWKKNKKKGKVKIKFPLSP